MILIRNHQSVPPHLAQAIITIGNFDGVHWGHQQLLTQLKQRSQTLGVPCGVILFEPQPQEFFSQTPPARLSTFRQKYHLIKQQGIDFIMVLRFNSHWAQLSAKDFITQVLWQQLHIKEIWVGRDFRFGHERVGDFSLLCHYGTQYDFQVQCMPDIQLDGHRVSSTQIRHVLAQGQLPRAQQLLGRYFSMEGKVIPGDARGRLLNMPTANIKPKYKVPLQGIFVVRVSLGGKKWPAVASLGTRPVFAGQQTLLEVHIINFNQDIYGERLCVEFLHKLRDEAHFDSIALLQAQMQQDLQEAKDYWKQHHDEL